MLEWIHISKYQVNQVLDGFSQYFSKLIKDQLHRKIVPFSLSPAITYMLLWALWLIAIIKSYMYRYVSDLTHFSCWTVLLILNSSHDQLNMHMSHSQHFSLSSMSINPIYMLVCVHHSPENYLTQCTFACLLQEREQIEINNSSEAQIEPGASRF